MWTLAVPTRNPYVYVGLLFVGMRIAALSTMVQHAVDAMKAKRANEGPPMIYECVVLFRVRRAGRDRVELLLGAGGELLDSAFHLPFISFGL